MPTPISTILEGVMPSFLFTLNKKITIAVATPPMTLITGNTYTKLSGLICPIEINNAIAKPPPTLIPKIPGSAIGFLVTL